MWGWKRRHTVKNWGVTIKHADNALKSDREIAYAAVKEDGWAIEHLPIELQNDKIDLYSSIDETSFQNTLLYLKYVGEGIFVKIKNGILLFFSFEIFF